MVILAKNWDFWNEENEFLVRAIGFRWFRGKSLLRELVGVVLLLKSFQFSGSMCSMPLFFFSDDLFVFFEGDFLCVLVIIKFWVGLFMEGFSCQLPWLFQFREPPRRGSAFAFDQPRRAWLSKCLDYSVLKYLRVSFQTRIICWYCSLYIAQSPCKPGKNLFLYRFFCDRLIT